MKKQNLKRHVLFTLLFAGAVAMGLFSCANDVGSSDYIADNSGDHYYGINGGSGSSSTGTMTPAVGGGTSGGGTTATVSRIGTKAAPDAVGDIVFSDGSATAYNDTAFDFDAHKNEAVAVIFDAGATKKGLGFETLFEELTPCWPGITGYRPGGPFQPIVSNMDDGMVNCETMWNLVSSHSNFSTLFEALAWAYNYSAPGYTSGWYIPAKNELGTIYANEIVIRAALKKAGVSNPNGRSLGVTSSSLTGMDNNGYFSSWVWYKVSIGSGAWSEALVDGTRRYISLVHVF